MTTTINERIAAAMQVVADSEAEARRQDARAANERLHAQRDGLRKVLGDLYDALGVGVDAGDGGWFILDGVQFEVEYSPARHEVRDWDARVLSEERAACVVFRLGIWDEGGRAMKYDIGTPTLGILAWIGERVASEKALRAVEAEAELLHRGLTGLVAGLIEKAEAGVWQWPEGYVLEYWHAQWHKGGGQFGSAYTFDVPDDGDLLVTIYDDEILLSEAHLPVYTRMTAESIMELPLILREWVSVTVPGVTRNDHGRLVTAPGQWLEVPTNKWVPILPVIEFIEDTSFEVALRGLADAGLVSSNDDDVEVDE